MIATAATPGLARDAARRWDPWVEVKWDGIRAIGVWDGRRLHLRARSGNDITAKYPELTRVDAGLGPEPAVIDGEIVALDAQGRPSFPRLQSRMNLSKPREIERETPRTPVHYFLFDVLAHAGADVAALPLAERRGILEGLAAEAIAPIVLPPVFDDVDAALAGARDFGLEGIVVKDPGSTYRRGIRSESWLKVKLTRTQEVVIGAIRPGRGGRTGSIGSLLLGIPGPEGLAVRGSRRIGLQRLDAREARGRADAAADRSEPVRRDSGGGCLGRPLGAARARRRGRIRRVHPRRHPAPLALAGAAARQAPRRGRRARADARGCSGVRVVLDVPGRLELEGRVLDVEVLGEAPLQLGEDLARAALAIAAASTTTWALKTGAPRVSCHTCTSCTSTTPGVERMCSRISCTCMPFGVASLSTDTTSRSRPIARGMIIAAMSSEAMASAGIQPVVTITIAATMTTAEPSRSPITSRYAPRTLMLVRCAELSSHIATAFATSPTMATTSISPPATSTSAGLEQSAERPRPRPTPTAR